MLGFRSITPVTYASTQHPNAANDVSMANARLLFEPHDLDDQFSFPRAFVLFTIPPARTLFL